MTAGATPESSGVFTIDLEEALRRLGQSGQAKSEYAILKLVQAGVASGAARVDVSTGWWETSVQFTPARPPRLQALLEEVLQRAGYEHFLAVACAVRRELGRVAVEYRGRRHLFARRGSWDEQCPLHESLRIRYRRQWSSGEAALLRERCQWAAVPVYLNGVSLRPSFWTRSRAEDYFYDDEESANRLAFPACSRAQAPPLVPAQRLGPVIRCRSALAYGCGGMPGIDFVQHGVVIHTRGLSGEQLFGENDLGGRAVVDATGLATDLSGFQLVEGTALENLVERTCREGRRLSARARPGC